MNPDAIAETLARIEAGQAELRAELRAGLTELRTELRTGHKQLEKAIAALPESDRALLASIQKIEENTMKLLRKRQPRPDR